MDVTLEVMVIPDCDVEQAKVRQQTGEELPQ